MQRANRVKEARFGSAKDTKRKGMKPDMVSQAEHHSIETYIQ